ncbi:MAG: hypothetical protein R3F11_00535 [Verrucomicrobiales bacterium]
MLSVIASAVAREDLGEGPSHECDLTLGGLDSLAGEHQNWGKQKLIPGDKILIEVLDDGEFDPPEDRQVRDPEQEERMKKDYIRQVTAELGWTVDEG